MLKGRDKTSGLVQKDSGYALSNSSNNEKVLSTKTQDVTLDLERTKGKFETYGQSSVNVGPGIKLEIDAQKKTGNTLVADVIKELMSESITPLKEKLAMQQDTQTRLNNYLQIAKSTKESATFASELRNEIMNPGKQDARPNSTGKGKEAQANVLSNVLKTKPEELTGSKELVKLTTDQVKNDIVKKLKENNPVELDKTILTEKESRRKKASQQLQAKHLPVAEAVPQQKELKISNKSRIQLVKLKKLPNVKTKEDPKVGQETLIKKLLAKQFQDVQADLHDTLEAGLAAGKIISVVPFYI